MLQNSRVTAFTVSEVLRENQQGREGGKTHHPEELMGIFQNSLNKFHMSSGFEKIASPRFHAVSFVCK